MPKPHEVVATLSLGADRGFLSAKDQGQLASTARSLVVPFSREQICTRLLRRLPGTTALRTLTGASIETLAREFSDELAHGHLTIENYHDNGAGNRIEHADSEGFSLTARSLALDRFCRVDDRKRWQPPSMVGDTYASCLGLTDDVLRRWKNHKVLDIGCGGSPFHAEAQICYDIDVVPIDACPQEGATRKATMGVYAKNMLFLATLRHFGATGKCGVIPTDDATFGKLMGELPAVVGYFLEAEVTKGSVFKLPERDADVCLSSWMFSYMPQHQRALALTEMASATKVGGELRICPGMLGEISVESARIPDSTIEAANQALARTGRILFESGSSEWFRRFEVRDPGTKCVIQ